MGPSDRLVEEEALQSLLTPIGLRMRDIKVRRNIINPEGHIINLPWPAPYTVTLTSQVLSCINVARDFGILPVTVLYRSDGKSHSLGAISRVACLPLIQADGHCLYRSIEDQLHQEALVGAPVPGYQELRERAAGFMRDHPDDFIPFIYDEVRMGRGWR